METIRVSGRWTVEEHLFDIAVEHAKKASKVVNRNNIKKMQIESKHSLIAIIMSVFSLEALANSIGMEYYGDHPDPERSKKWAKILNKPLTNKLKLLATDAYQHKTNKTDKKTLPKNVTKLLDDLVDLRHSIVHYKAIPINVKRLRSTSKNEPISQELDRYTSQEAKEAIRTVVEVVNAFNKLSRKEYGEWVSNVLNKYSIKI